MLDEEAGIVGSAEEGRLTAQAEADGAEDGGFAGSVWTYYYVESRMIKYGKGEVL